MKSYGDMNNLLDHRGRGVKRVKEAENVRAPLMDFGKTSTFLLPSNASCSPSSAQRIFGHIMGLAWRKCQMERIMKFADKVINRVRSSKRHFMNGFPSGRGKRQMRRNLKPNPMATSALADFRALLRKGRQTAREGGREGGGLSCQVPSLTCQSPQIHFGDKLKRPFNA